MCATGHKLGGRRLKGRGGVRARWPIHSARRGVALAGEGAEAAAEAAAGGAGAGAEAAGRAGWGMGAAAATGAVAAAAWAHWRLARRILGLSGGQVMRQPPARPASAPSTMGLPPNKGYYDEQLCTRPLQAAPARKRPRRCCLRGGWLRGRWMPSRRRARWVARVTITTHHPHPFPRRFHHTVQPQPRMGAGRLGRMGLLGGGGGSAGRWRRRRGWKRWWRRRSPRLGKGRSPRLGTRLGAQGRRGGGERAAAKPWERCTALWRSEWGECAAHMRAGSAWGSCGAAEGRGYAWWGRRRGRSKAQGVPRDDGRAACAGHRA